VAHAAHGLPLGSPLTAVSRRPRAHPPPILPRLQPKHARLAEDGGKTNSVDSSSTAAGQGAAAHSLLQDSATLLPPLRQISLDIIAATELNRAKELGQQPQRENNIFQDVFNEVRRRPRRAAGQAVRQQPQSACAALLCSAQLLS